MCRKSIIVLGFASLLTYSTRSSASLVDNFNSYTDQVSFQAAWKPWSANGSSMTFAQGIGRNGSGGIHGAAAVNYQMRNARDLDSFTDYYGTDADPVKFEVWVYDSNPSMPAAPNGARNFIELRAYTADGVPAYGSPGLQGLIAMGLYNTPVSDDNFHARVYYGGVNNWYSLNTQRTLGWHKLTSLIGDTEIRFYVDDVLDTTVPLIDNTRLFAWDGVVLGSGLTSGGYDATFDDLSVARVPDPITVVLLVLGGLLMSRLR
jgi:hypothetical protein